MSQKHTDSRGFFQELYHFNEDDWMPAQMSWFSIEPGQQRGHHFHTKTQEMFFVLEGQVQVVNSRFVLDNAMVETFNQGEIIRTFTGHHHAFYSKDGAKLLVFSNRHFNENDPDTFRSGFTKSVLDRSLKAM